MGLPENTGASRSWARDLLLLTLAFAALYFFRLGSYPLSNPDEARNAEVPREMLVSGDWVTPRLDGVNYFEKPPLVYWVTAVFEDIFGLNEWAVRAVPALFAMVGILGTYAAARSLYGRRTGWLASAVLGTTVLWFVVGHIPLLDTAVSVFMAGTLFCFLLGVREAPGSRRRWLFYGLYVCAALATLSKGMIGFLVPGAVMVLWLTICGQWSRLRPLYLPTGVLLFLAIALPWHVLAALRNETWFHRYIVFEHFIRFLTPAASRPGPWHYFIWIIIGGMIPWTGWLWTAGREALRGGWGARQANADRWFFLIWAAFVFLFFSKSQSKLPTYILPIFPALAVLVAVEIERAWSDRAASRVRLGLRTFAFFCGLLAVGIAVIATRPELAKLDPDQAQALHAPAIVMVIILVAAGVVVPALPRFRGAPWGIVGCAVAMATFYGALEFAAPALNKPGTKELALYVKAHAQPTDRVFTVYDFYQDFTFYAERLIGVVGSNVAELELSEDATARKSGRFIDDATLRREWSADGRIFLVVQKDKIEQARRSYAAAMAKWNARRRQAAAKRMTFSEQPPGQPVFADPDFHYHTIAQTTEYALLSNRP